MVISFLLVTGITYGVLRGIIQPLPGPGTCTTI
jgi:hypothetical protein